MTARLKAKTGQIAKRETARLNVLRSFGILDTKPEPGFDDLVLLAARVCRVPMAIIGFFDAERYWVKAQIGLKLDAMPREFALYAPSEKPEFQEIPDTLADSRLAEHPMVSLWPKIRFYAGVPIMAAGDQLLGVLEVMDQTPRQLEPGEREGLLIVARQLSAQLDLRRTAEERECGQQELAEIGRRAQRRFRRHPGEHGARRSTCATARPKATGARDRDHGARWRKRWACPMAQLSAIRRGALLHDIGKMGIPDGILLKPGTLTDEEWVVMRQHPLYAYEMLSPIDLSAAGAGYPLLPSREAGTGRATRAGCATMRSRWRRVFSRWWMCGTRCARTGPTGRAGLRRGCGITSASAPGPILTRTWLSSFSR